MALSNNPNQAKVVKAVKDLETNKQDILVSGTNIKTINNESILGSGNITVSGGGGSTEVQVDSASITSQGVANLKTINGNYDASTNKLATREDIFNPNILSNSDFRINTQGSASYTGAVYGVNLWKGLRSTTVVTPNSSGTVAISGTVKEDGIVQFIGNPYRFNGKRLTATIKVSALSGKIKFWIRNGTTWASFGTVNVASTGIYSVTGTVSVSSTDAMCVYIDFSASSSTTNSATIDWVKLEEGEVYTPYKKDVGHRVVEYFIASDKSYWYRVWSDGWKECGIYFEATFSQNANTVRDYGNVALPISFSNIKYNAQITNVWKSSGGHSLVWDTSEDTATVSSIFLVYLVN